MRHLVRLRFVGLLAILLQVMAPGWAMASFATAVTVGGLDAAICSIHDARPDPAGGERPAPGLDHHALCPLCQAVGASAHVLPASAADSPSPRLAGPVSHPHLTLPAPRGPPEIQRRARAPPALS